jgi:hypothetical protein
LLDRRVTIRREHAQLRIEVPQIVIDLDGIVAATGDCKG